MQSVAYTLNCELEEHISLIFSLLESDLVTRRKALMFDESMNKWMVHNVKTDEWT